MITQVTPFMCAAASPTTSGFRASYIQVSTYASTSGTAVKSVALGKSLSTLTAQDWPAPTTSHPNVNTTALMYEGTEHTAYACVSLLRMCTLKFP